MIVTLSRSVNPREIVEVRITVEALQAALISSLPHRTLLLSVREKGPPRRRVAAAHQTEQLKNNRNKSSHLPQSVMNATTTKIAKDPVVIMQPAAVVRAANHPNLVGVVAAVVTGMSTAAAPIQEAEIIKEVAVRVHLHTKSDQC